MLLMLQLREAHTENDVELSTCLPAYLISESDFTDLPFRLSIHSSTIPYVHPQSVASINSATYQRVDWHSDKESGSS
jgi:hypothetical protein